ncbi:hypothetical protein [Sedimentimonas flavescens]|uniref:hypothetical protein n=1 Tax=Sedimentimonas flavescens TaxID=2851012 RepID=UPI001C4A60C2|nr:hypothetical protein [Sedimentimonas flavescens]MBW0159488.1 hypothetical protein [Sedimentimonas flavescens]
MNKEVEAGLTMQDNSAPNPISIEEMKASVGSILFLWSSVERELAKRIIELGGGALRSDAHTISQKITRWESLQTDACAARPEHQALLRDVRGRLTMSLDIRNRIAHGLIGITADPFGDQGDAHLMTELNGETRKHTHSDLEHVMRVLAHMVSAISALSRAAKEQDSREAERSYRGIRLNHLP